MIGGVADRKTGRRKQEIHRPQCREGRGHEPGTILHGVYEGTEDNLGKPIGLGGSLGRSDATGQGVVHTVVDALRRSRRTVTQTDLPEAQRLANVSGAFRLRRSVRITGQVLVLVDDPARGKVIVDGGVGNEAGAGPTDVEEQGFDGQGSELGGLGGGEREGESENFFRFLCMREQAQNTSGQ